MRPRLVSMVFSASLLALAAADPAHAAFPGQNGKVAFGSLRDGNNEIYSMNPDGSSPTRLTNNTAVDAWPAWSPDGTKIAFYTDRDSNITDELYTMNADGSAPARLTNSGDLVVNIFPDWAPDGMKIFFGTNRDEPNRLTCSSCNHDIYSVNPDGSSLTNLTNTLSQEADPAASPDGTKIAFASNRDGNDEIYTMNSDGTNLIRLTNKSVGDGEPHWQPLPGSNPPPPYPAPKFASPVRAALVPVFRQCGSGGNPVNASHSPPLATGSCTPPKPGSVAHFGPQSTGFAQLAVIYGDTNAANGDQANVTIRSSLSDIQTATGADYEPNPGGADATLVTRFRFTDRANGGSGGDPGTATDLDFSVPVDCAATGASTLGSACGVDTTADTVTPGLIKENKATVLQTFRFRLNDSGVNGIRGDSDDKIFATQGVFIP